VAKIDFRLVVHVRVSARPSVRMEQPTSTWDEASGHFICESFSIIYEYVPLLFKVEQEQQTLHMRT
jgi:hypothetical protein